MPSSSALLPVRGLRLHPSLLVLMILAAPLGAGALECQNFTCTIIGTDRQDEIAGSPGDDVICGLRGNDVIRGNGGNDLICGGPGNDQLYGDAGHDVLLGGGGKDRLYGGSGNDELDGNQGNDALNGGVGDDYLVGGHGRDLLDGGDGSDHCESERGDTLSQCQPLQEVASASGEPFSLVGSQIVAPDGSAFVPRGVNIFPWHRSTGTIQAIQDCWNFNMVRLHAWIFAEATSQWKDHIVYVGEPLIFDPAQTDYTTYDVSSMIEQFTSRGVVVLFDVHEFLGSYIEGQAMEDYLSFIRDFATRYRDNPYVWLDMHNEPGAYEGRTGDFMRWRTEVQRIVGAVREIAPRMMLLVPGTAWGQDTGPDWSAQPVVTENSALLANDDLIRSYSHLVPTFHVYDQWTFGNERLRDYVARLYARVARPVIVGEYGSVNNVSTLNASASLHWLAAQNGFENLGRVVWTWDAKDGNDLTTTLSGGGQHVDSCVSPGNLSPLGELVWQDNHR